MLIPKAAAPNKSSTPAMNPTPYRKGRQLVAALPACIEAGRGYSRGGALGGKSGCPGAKRDILFFFCA